MANEDGSVWVTYNGEIYNHRDLRSELEGAGHRFRSRSDTEVIVHAYEQWGTSCVRRFEGMFAFGLWDERAQRLVLARDPVGIKPLYYYRDETVFAFASEMKAITAIEGVDKTLDETALYDFLTYLYVPAPKTPYRRIRKLQPGHTLVLESGRVCIDEYWDVNFAQGCSISEADAIEGVRQYLEMAVRSQLMSDVPVGCLLSGGVDSSAVTAIAQRHLPSRLRTFSIGFDVEENSEVRWARLVARRFATEHVERTVSLARASEILPRLVSIYDEPFGDSSAIPTVAVSEVAREHVKVVLSGDGGDEVFGGYWWYARHLRRERFPSLPLMVREHLPSWIERTRLVHVRGIPRLVDTLRCPIERHVVMMGGWTKSQKSQVLRADVVRRFRDYDDYWYFRQYWREDLDLISRLQYLDMKTYLPDDILTKVDRASMSVSLEVRPPLLDRRLIEFVAGLPSDIRVRGGQGKHIFKRALEGVLPEEILRRPKKGFSVPLPVWLEQLDGGSPVLNATPTQRWLALTLKDWYWAAGTNVTLLSE